MPGGIPSRAQWSPIEYAGIGERQSDGADRDNDCWASVPDDDVSIFERSVPQWRDVSLFGASGGERSGGRGGRRQSACRAGTAGY